MGAWFCDSDETQSGLFSTSFDIQGFELPYETGRKTAFCSPVCSPVCPSLPPLLGAHGTVLLPRLLRYTGGGAEHTVSEHEVAAPT